MKTAPLGDTADKTMNTCIAIFDRPNCGLLGIQSPGAHTVEDKGSTFVCRKFNRIFYDINGNINGAGNINGRP